MSTVQVEVMLSMSQEPDKFPDGLTPEHHERGPLGYVAHRLAALEASEWKGVPVTLWCPFGRQPFGSALADDDTDSKRRRLIRFVPWTVEHLLCRAAQNNGQPVDDAHPSRAWADRLLGDLPELCERYNVRSVYLGDWGTVNPGVVHATALVMADRGVRRIIVDHAANDDNGQIGTLESMFHTIGGAYIREGRPRDGYREFGNEHLMFAREDKPNWGAATRYEPPPNDALEKYDAVGIALSQCRTAEYARSWTRQMETWGHKTARLLLGPASLARFSRKDVLG